MMAQLSYIMTLANSIIGVSVLAMPFCFKQCGIVLATLVLLLSSVLSRLACHFLIKSAVMSRRRNFELLAFHAFGHMGKFLVELFIIGFLVGTCIAFFVVMGDVGPQIVGKIINKNPEDIRTSLLVTTSVFIVLPLGLLRNIDSLSSISTATIVFYLCLVLKIMAESMQHIFAGDWYDHVFYWRPSGILQCIPIFSMALFCQTQLFEIYETVPNVSLEKMNEVVRGALNICTIVYLCVGFFGYIAFCTQPFSGNILMSFEPSLSSEMIKMGFVFSVAFSFPLVIFPCRASLNSLLFRRVYTHEPSINYLPETRFRCLTIAVVAMSLIIGILIPNIEFVLGLVGSTIGVIICVIFPAIFFISISSKNTNERLIAQAILFVGICIMILSTYANLYAMEESTNTKVLATTTKPLSQINSLPLNFNKDDIHAMRDVPNDLVILPNVKEKLDQLPDVNILDNSINLKTKDVRQEPPIPVERIAVTEKLVAETQKSMDMIATFGPAIKIIVEKMKTLDEDLEEASKTVVKAIDSVPPKVEGNINGEEQRQKPIDIQKNDNLINSDAIKKEESELAADAEAGNIMVDERHEELRKTLEKHKLEQLQMMQEQKEILKDIKEQKQEIEREKQRIAKDVQEYKENEQKSKQLQEQIVAKEDRKNLADSKINKEKDHVNEIEYKDERMNLNEEFQQAELNKNFKKTKNSKDEEPRMLHKKEFENISKDDNVYNEKTAVKDTKEFLLIKNVSNVEMLDNKLSEDKNVKEPERLSNAKKLPKGPILNALAKRALQNSISAGKLINNKNDTKNDQKAKNISDTIIPNTKEKPHLETEDQKVEDRYSLPIALKMRNQTKLNNVPEPSLNKSEENMQVIHRDILQNHEREKREVHTEVKENNTKVVNDDSDKVLEFAEKNSTSDDNQQECFKPRDDLNEKITESKKEKGQTISESAVTEISLIKTNIYLSEQEFADPISVDPNISVRGKYVNVKQRDLKAVNANENSGI